MPGPYGITKVKNILWKFQNIKIVELGTTLQPNKRLTFTTMQCLLVSASKNNCTYNMKSLRELMGTKTNDIKK